MGFVAVVLRQQMIEDDSASRRASSGEKKRIGRHVLHAFEHHACAWSRPRTPVARGCCSGDNSRPAPAAAIGLPVLASVGRRRWFGVLHRLRLLRFPAQQAGQQAQHAAGAEEQGSEDRRTIEHVVEQVLASSGAAQHAARVIEEADASGRRSGRQTLRAAACARLRRLRIAPRAGRDEQREKSTPATTAPCRRNCSCNASTRLRSR